ncbi:MAG: MFS transporter [Planctomycetaceae bacterium]
MPLYTPELRTDRGLKLRLYGMMFLQYFVQGCYLPVISVYLQDGLKFSPTEIGAFGAALAIGPLAAPFIIGQLVDRHAATEGVLAFCHLTGAAIMLVLYAVATHLSQDFDVFWLIVALGTLYSTLYVPSMMLTNSLAFHHLEDADREFPVVRMFGTLGFIAPFFLVEFVFLRGLEGSELNSARAIVLALSAAGGLLMGAYCFLLPHTPPAARDRRDLAPGKVLGQLARRTFLSLVIASVFIAIVHKFYFVWNSPFLRAVLDQGGVKGAWEQTISSLGQFFEIIVMLVLGLLVRRFGFKRTMLLGAFAYLLRCLIFSYAIASGLSFPATMTLVCIGQALHGVCFGCFLATAYMFVDHVSGPSERGSMQTFYGTFVLGLGFFVGGIIAGQIGDAFTTERGRGVRRKMGIQSRAGLLEAKREEGKAPQERDWPALWLSSAGIAAVALLVFAASFPSTPPEDEE